MRTRESHFMQTMTQQRLSSDCWIDRKIRPAKSELDPYLPNADRTEDERVRRVVQGLPGGMREFPRFDQRPDQQMRIEQESQNFLFSMMSIISANSLSAIVSKSSGTVYMPSSAPIQLLEAARS